jgi:hypothetical protein
MLSALGGVLSTVGAVAGQPTAIGGDEMIDEVLQLPYTWQGVQKKRGRASEGGGHCRVHRSRAAVATTVRGYRPGGRLALFDAKPYRPGNATLLVWHRRYTTVTIERLEQSHRPHAEPAGPVEHESELWGPLSHDYRPDCTIAVRLEG